MKSFASPEPGATKAIRVLLVDDNVYFLEAARDLLNLGEALEVIDSVTNGMDALARVSRLQPDVLLLDLNLGGQSGLELIPTLKEAHPQMKIIILTMMEAEPYCTAALNAGADAFARKSEMSKALIPAIVALMNTSTGGHQSVASDHGVDSGSFAGTPSSTHERKYMSIPESSEASHNLLFDHNPLPMWVYDVETYQFLAVNHAAVEKYGWSKAEFLSMTIKDIRPSEDIIPLIENVERVGEGLDEAGIWRHIKKDGSLIYVEIISHTLVYNGRRAELVVVKDVTEQKQAEKALRKSEERFRSYIENANDNIFTLDPSGRITSANRIMCEKLGCTEAELQGLSAVDIAVPERRAEVAQALRRIWAGEPVEELEVPIQTFKGKTFIVQIRGRAIYKDGELVETLHIARDVTEQRRAEEQLHLRGAALEAAANAIVITDAQGSIQWINPAYTRLTGYSMEESSGQNPRILKSGAQDEPFYRELWDTILTGKPWRGELINKHKDGSLYHEEQIITQFTNSTGQATHFIGIKQDITERKRAEEQIQNQLKRLNALREIDQAIASTFDLGTSLSVLLNHTVNLLSMDAATVLLLNPTLNTLEFEAGVGFRTNALETAGVKLRTSYAGIAAMERRLVQIPDLTHEPNNLFHTEFLKGEDFFSYYGAPLIVKGKVIGVLEVFSRSLVERNEAWLEFFATLAGQAAIAVDNAQLFSAAQKELAERRRAEEELRKLNAELEARVEARTAELERALRIKDEFLANMSHELRTPLNAIVSLSDSLVEKIAGPLNDKQNKYVTVIKESGNHLLELINDILDIAKVDSGQITFERQQVDVHAVCTSSLRMISELAQKKAQQVTFEADERLEQIWADERRLKQMLVNLLSNAVKFTPEYGKIGLVARGNWEERTVSFTVWDTGIGIKEHDLARLFRPFVQLDSELSSKASGTGLGLALVAQMARLQGGGVGIESEPGKGSRFTVTLPLETVSIMETMPLTRNTDRRSTRKPEEKQKKGTILLVEDTDDAIMVIQDYLEYEGYTVAIAQNGIEAISQANKIHPDLILMDIQMPKMDGFEATRRLREEAELKHTPIIALTAFAMPGDRERCLAAGMDEYITKPVNLKMLARMLTKALDNQGAPSGDDPVE